MGILSGEDGGEMLSIIHGNENKTEKDFKNRDEYIEYLRGELEIANREADEASKLSFENTLNKELQEKAIVKNGKVADLEEKIWELTKPPIPSNESSEK